MEECRVKKYEVDLRKSKPKKVWVKKTIAPSCGDKQPAIIPVVAHNGEREVGESEMQQKDHTTVNNQQGVGQK